MTETNHTATDPAQPGYYARRGVTSENEQQMRADAVRAARLCDEGLNADTEERFAELFAQAERIENQWRNHESATAQADWAYLSDARDDWRRAPGTMERLYEQVIIDRVDGATDGMSSAEWRSQRQAREMAGGGDWPQTRDPFSVEAVRSRPTSTVDVTSPNHYAGSASHWAEQVMRADFARVYQLDQERNQTYTDSEYVRITEQMHEIAEPWVTREDALSREWRDMRTLAADTYSSFAEYADAVERFEQYLPEHDARARIFERSADQVQELKGIARPYFSNDMSHAPLPVASSSFAAARTAELRQCGRAPIPGHAFAGLVGGREREGVER